MAVDFASAAVRRTEDLLLLSRRHLGLRERIRGKKLERMLSDESGKTLTLQIADQVFRSKVRREQSREFCRLLKAHGVPRYLWSWERCLMFTGSILSRLLPRLVMPLIEFYIKAESRNVIKPAEEHILSSYIKERRNDGFSINLNILGEAVLGEQEANRRLNEIVSRLENRDVDYISVKISAIFSQINLVAYELSVNELKSRLRKIYRAAKSASKSENSSEPAPKFVNLDMEDYRDFHLTVRVFKDVLGEPEFINMEAGIVLQAYLPDAISAQEELTQWAIQRVSDGGACIKIRIVKGANLAMEQMEASLHGWPQAPYEKKVDSDANFKRMVRYGCAPANARAVRIGIGSHNLFDISYAMIFAHENGVSDRIEFEMLEGMANHQASALLSQSGNLLLYSPIVENQNFLSALAYLVRRLDENTSEDNYLRHAFLMMPGTEAWDIEKNKFLEACKRSDKGDSTPRRTQDRSAGITYAPCASAGFVNSPDTDWSLPANRTWIGDHIDKWQSKEQDPVPLQIGGEFHFPGAREIQAPDVSRPNHTAYSHALASIDDVEATLNVASTSFDQWSQTAPKDRKTILQQAAALMERERGDTIGCLILDGAKSAKEADSEVSEAIDFANYYARHHELEGIENCDFKGRGVVVIAPPWNFPYAIPAGGVLAALAAGNTVILKPALHTVLSSYRLAQQLWEAGIPHEVLQFLPCPDNEIGRSLITDRRVDTVVLTGSYMTGKLFKEWRSDLHLIAETSGKNSMVITSSCDTEQAANDLVQSAFGHSGQKCSAASLALVDAEIYNREDFRRQLLDAAKSLHVGSAWDPRSVITPLVDPPGKDLTRALTTLDQGEQWLLKPTCSTENPMLWSPGIKTGVSPDGWFANTECFGPVLGLIKVNGLEDAIRIQNSGKFGLTGGIQSLNPKEISQWSNEVRVGNAYINRSITGAIVRRQPFGGWGHSSFGPGAKAGGPDYVMNFSSWKVMEPAIHQSKPCKELTDQIDELISKLNLAKSADEMRNAVGHYLWAYERIFSESHDPSNLVPEVNLLTYQPHKIICYRIEAVEPLTQIFLSAIGSLITGIDVDVSIPNNSLTEDQVNCLIQHKTIRVFQEPTEALASRIDSMMDSCRPLIIRYEGQTDPSLHQAANRYHLCVINGKVIENGRLELRHWFREKCVSETTHRYGNLLPRFREPV